MAARCPGDLAGLGAGRLLALDHEHVRFTGGGAALAASGDGPGSSVRRLARKAAPAVCPVRALETRLHGSDTRFGPVFRKVDRWGNIEHHRLVVSGPTEAVAEFQAAAQDPGIIPWRLDRNRVEENLFHLLAPRRPRRNAAAWAWPACAPWRATARGRGAPS